MPNDSFSFKILFGFKRPTFDRHVVFNQKILEIVYINTIVPARKFKDFQFITVYPFHYRAFTYLTIIRYITCH